jgi:hypothetical protein
MGSGAGRDDNNFKNTAEESRNHTGYGGFQEKCINIEIQV